MRGTAVLERANLLPNETEGADFDVRDSRRDRGERRAAMAVVGERRAAVFVGATTVLGRRSPIVGLGVWQVAVVDQMGHRLHDLVASGR